MVDYTEEVIISSLESGTFHLNIRFYIGKLYSYELPGVVKIYSIFSVENTFYKVMKYIISIKFSRITLQKSEISCLISRYRYDLHYVKSQTIEISVN